MRHSTGRPMVTCAISRSSSASPSTTGTGRAATSPCRRGPCAASCTASGWTSPRPESARQALAEIRLRRLATDAAAVRRGAGPGRPPTVSVHVPDGDSGRRSRSSPRTARPPRALEPGRPLGGAASWSTGRWSARRRSTCPSTCRSAGTCSAPSAPHDRHADARRHARLARAARAPGRADGPGD